MTSSLKKKKKINSGTTWLHGIIQPPAEDYYRPHVSASSASYARKLVLGKHSKVAQSATGNTANLAAFKFLLSFTGWAQRVQTLVVHVQQQSNRELKIKTLESVLYSVVPNYSGHLQHTSSRDLQIKGSHEKHQFIQTVIPETGRQTQPFIHLCKNKNLQETLLHLITGRSQAPHCMKVYRFSTFTINSQVLVCIMIQKLETSHISL